MKAKELAEILLKNPNLDVEICCPEEVLSYGFEHTVFRIYEDIDVCLVNRFDDSQAVQIDCL